MAEIGAIASIVGVAGAGAKLSLVLFEFASTVGSARVEVEQVGTEISQFCAVLTQLRSTLKKAKARRFSISAIDTTQDILERCQQVFKEIEDIVGPLQKGTGNSTETSVDIVARVKWTFKRSKVQVLQKTLESSKNSLQLMLQVLDLAQKTATPRTSTLDTLLEDEQEQAVMRSMIVAHQCAVDQLERLEDEEAQEQILELGEQTSSTEGLSLGAARVVRLPERSRANRNPMSRVIDEDVVPPPNVLGGVKKKRASAWVNDLIFDKSPLPYGFRRQTWGDSFSSSHARQQANYLVEKWTDEVPDVVIPAEQKTIGTAPGPQETPAVAIEDNVELRGNTWKSALSSTTASENTIQLRQAIEIPPLRPHHLEKLPPVNFVKAIYDYEGNERTSLSFHKGEVIQVITMLKSGWWDGVIHGVRGWFPSNYCKTVLSPGDEVESPDEDDKDDADEVAEGEVGYVYGDEEDEWSDEDELMGEPIKSMQHSYGRTDFWIPQSTPDGRMFYFNTETGESSMRIPGT